MNYINDLLLYGNGLGNFGNRNLYYIRTIKHLPSYCLYYKRKKC